MTPQTTPWNATRRVAVRRRGRYKRMQSALNVRKIGCDLRFRNSRLATMQINEQPPAAVPRKRWISITLLLLLVAFGGLLRFHNLTKQNLWLDEYWTLYLATGRGDSVFQLPQNQIIEHPPNVGFSAAPAWWHIWNGIRT